MQLFKTALDNLVARVQFSTLRCHVGLRSGIQLAGQLQLAGLQTQALNAMIDRADVFLFQAVELVSERFDAFDAFLQGWPGRFAFGHDPAPSLTLTR